MAPRSRAAKMWNKTTDEIATKRSPSICGMKRFWVVIRLKLNMTGPA